MRCPKCEYVGFEPSPRCKNCGYDLSLDSDSAHDRQSDDAPALTLVTKPGFDGPLEDFDLQIFDKVAAKRVQGGAKPFDLDDLLANGPSSGTPSRDAEPMIASVSAIARRRQSASASGSASASAVATPPPLEIEALFKPEPAASPAMSPPAPAPVFVAAHRAPVTTELPLFMQGMSEIREAPVVHAPVPASVEAAADAVTEDVAEVDDRPLVQVPTTLRAPLAVRRTTPDAARMRARYGRAARSNADNLEKSGDLLKGADQLEARVEPRVVPPAQRLSSEPTPASLPAEWLPAVGPAKRLMAAALDSVLLISLNAAVVWFTLSVCGLAPGQANLLPVAPLLLFFLLLDAGYLVLFTAACGQTIGKMAAGIRVVGTSTGAVINDRITIAQAVTRSLGSIVSMLPLGAGFWFGLVGDRRAAHDRLAHTRVVAA